MVYIPTKHQKYDLLPRCRKHGGEVFSYSCELLDEVHKYLPNTEGLTPYGFNSYQAYDDEIDRCAQKYGKLHPSLPTLLQELKEHTHIRNRKEYWAVV